ncbi:PIN domain-containing protein [Zavarzinella formosa]|uniref:PIN domain-containing protein n=1 Tax=Zavarzinella formosa TaxID=360055 RepID=UPI00030102C3|nr:PIN domain-containing protein [Zavarzinella formosa]
MSDVIVLDSTPLGILAHPRNPPHAAACRTWLQSLLTAGRRVIVAEIADYEIRRSLMRLASFQALANLDDLGRRLEYLSLSTPAMRLAADLWAQARNAGQPTAPDAALDGDVILAAQALTLGVPVMIATGNASHLSRYVPADEWQNIIP